MTIYLEYLAVCIGLIALFDVGLIAVSVAIIKYFMYKKMYSNFVRDVSISLRGKTYAVKGFIDTGNRLTDPKSGKPIMVISRDLYCEMLVPNGEYVNVATANGGGKMLTFAPSAFTVNGRAQDVILGVSTKNFRDYTKYDILLQCS